MCCVGKKGDNNRSRKQISRTEGRKAYSILYFCAGSVLPFPDRREGPACRLAFFIITSSGATWTLSLSLGLASAEGR